MIRRRLRVSREALARESIEIVGSALRHLHVLRLQAGDRIYLFDGDGSEVESEILGVERERAEARPVVAIEGEVETPVECWLVQAVPVRVRRMVCNPASARPPGGCSGGSRRPRAALPGTSREVGCAHKVRRARSTTSVDRPVPCPCSWW